MPYRLVKLNEDGTNLQGEELRSYLISVGFTVPQIQPQNTQPLPTTTGLTNDNNWPLLVWDAWNQGQFNLLYNQVINSNRNALTEYELQFVNFASALINIYDLVLAKRVVIGYTPQGQNIWGYQVMPCQYSPLQAAKKLMGYGVPRPEDPIEFIVNGNFG